MALSGTARQTFTNNGSHDLVIRWSAKQNIAGNYSDITANLYLKGNYSYSTVESGSVRKYVSITINGNKSPLGQARVDIRGTEEKHLHTFTHRVNHDSNGNATFKIRGAVDIGIWWHGRQENTYNMSDKTFTLDKISRGSTLSFDGSSVNYGDRLKFTINASDSGFRHIVKLNVAGFNGTILSNQTAGYKTYETSRSWMSSLSSSTTTTATVTLDTYSGNSRIDSKNYNIEFRIPNDVSPTFSNLGHSEYNSKVSNVLGSSSGKYVQGLSRIKFNVSAEGGYNSSIRSTSIHIQGQSINGDILDLSSYKTFVGSISYEVKAIDSRSREISSRGTLEIMAYYPPRISSFQAYRNGSGGIDISRSGSISELNVGGYNRNSMTSRLYLKEFTGSYWDQQGSSSSSFSSTSISNVQKGKSYQVKTTIEDKFMEIESIVTVSTERALLNLHKEKGIGIGKMHEKGILDVDGDIYLNGQVYGRRAYFTNGFTPFEIKSGENLDGYRRSMSFRCTSYTASSLRNCPTNKAFSLTVNEVGEADGAANQVLIENVSESPKMYMRSYDGYRWSKWECVYGTSLETELDAAYGWQKYASGIGDASSPRAVRKGNTVWLTGAFSNKYTNPSGKVSTMGYVPEWARPSGAKIVRRRNQGSGMNTYLLEVTPKGEVNISRYGRANDYADCGAGSWLLIDCCYVVD